MRIGRPIHTLVSDDRNGRLRGQTCRRDMPPQALEEFAVPGVPQLGRVIPPSTCDHGAVGRELDVVHFVLVAQLRWNH